MRRYIRPFISVMPDQIITGSIRNHDFFPFKIHIFYREHHIFIKKKRASTPAHGITITFFLLIGKHDLLKFPQCSVFPEKCIAYKPVKILKCRNFPTYSKYCPYIKKICIDHHMCPVFFIFTVIIRNWIQCQHIDDLSSFVLSDDLMLMDRTAVCTGITRKSVRICPVYIRTVDCPIWRHFCFTDLYEFIPVTFWHVNIHIIIPGDKTFISKDTNQGSPCHHISKIMLFADFINLSEELQKKLLFFSHLSTSLINNFQKLRQCFRFLIKKSCAFCPFITDHDRQLLQKITKTIPLEIKAVSF